MNYDCKLVHSMFNKSLHKCFVSQRYGVRSLEYEVYSVHCFPLFYLRFSFNFNFNLSASKLITDASNFVKQGWMDLSVQVAMTWSIPELLKTMVSYFVIKEMLRAFCDACRSLDSRYMESMLKAHRWFPFKLLTKHIAMKVALKDLSSRRLSLLIFLRLRR